MPTGIFDIHDRAEVITPHEIEAGKAQCLQTDTHYIQRGAQVIPLAAHVEALNKRWMRAARTFRLIENIRNGYCSVEPVTAVPTSDARH